MTGVQTCALPIYELFGFGFTGWKPAQDNLSIAGKHLFQGNLTNRSPRLSRQFFGITA